MTFNPIDERNLVIAQLGGDFLGCTLVPVEFPSLCSVGKFWKRARAGTFLLVTSGKNPVDGICVYMTLLTNGILHSTSSRLLERQLVAVYLVTGLQNKTESGKS
jgi:hypothetical protein